MVLWRTALAGDAEGGDAELQIGDGKQRVGAGGEGGTGGEHVVDQQHMPPLQLLGMAHAEGAIDVGAAVGALLATLLTGVAVAHHGIGVDLAGHHLGDAAAEQRALVVAAF